MRIESDVQNTDRSFYTDLNGFQVWFPSEENKTIFIIIDFQIIRRKYLEKIPLQGNVYPMPTTAFIEDTSARLTFVSGQPNGVTSVQTGDWKFLAFALNFVSFKTFRRLFGSFHGPTSDAGRQ